MRGEQAGKVLLKVSTRAHAVKMAELAELIGTPSGRATSEVALFFGPTIAGEARFVEVLGLNLDRALLGGHEIAIKRPFRADEPLEVEMRLAEYSEKNGMQFGTIETRFATPGGEEVQTQRTTFIERMA